MTKVLLDTDIGSDIDDAVCLAYLLAQPECELLGVTTVTGQALERAMMASALCNVAGRDVPIFPGADAPLVIEQKQKTAPQADALAKWPHDTEFPRGEAVEFLRSTIRQNPGEIILLTIGPLTNAGLLFAVDPEIPSLLRGLVMMCGMFGAPPEGRGPLEWNAKGDPHATRIAYGARPPLHRSVGLDVTLQCRMKADEVRSRFRCELLRPVLDFAEVWFAGTAGAITFHDPLAAATIFDDGICTFEAGSVEVELEDAALLGRTRWTAGGGDPPHQVAFTVDPDRFFEHYFSAFH